MNKGLVIERSDLGVQSIQDLITEMVVNVLIDELLSPRDEINLEQADE